MAKRSEAELRLSRAAAERHALAFERWMAAFDRHEQSFELHQRSFDRHEQAFDRHEQAFERHEEDFKRVMASLDRHEAQHGDLKVFIRDMNRRSEKVINDLLRGNREFCKGLTTKTDSKAEAIMAELKDLREESQAQRQALLNLIDRLPPPRTA
jgi:predicted translin family RNA/ssDNA-binding protein